jgi:hypothetical protein
VLLLLFSQLLGTVQYLSEGWAGANMDGANTFFIQIISGVISFLKQTFGGAQTFFKTLASA